MTHLELDRISNSGTIREKQFVFEKILHYSSNMLKNIHIFSQSDIEYLLKNYKVPTFNHNYINDRYKIMKKILLGEDVTIKRLEWR